MNERVQRAGLRVDPALAEFLERDVLAPLGRDPAAFWCGFDALCNRFAAQNRTFLMQRKALQAQIDAWHTARAAAPHDASAYRAFLEDIGYLVRGPGEFLIATENVDPELAALAGPQLVVPAMDERIVLDAANARWGSLYDAWYGSDALPAAPPAPSSAYSPERGAAVIAAGRAFLVLTLPLEGAASWADWRGDAVPDLCEPACFAGRKGGGLLFRHHGLHIELVIDPEHPVGAGDPAGIADIVLESALTTIVDVESSVVPDRVGDKVRAYRNWLGLMGGDLTTPGTEGGSEQHRVLASDREWLGADRSACTIKGRSLLLVRSAGLHTTSPAVHLADGSEIPEGILDAVVTSAVGAYDAAGLGRFHNSACGSIYIVQPNLHGPDECLFSNALLNAVEELFELPRHTVKLGLVDEERRTSLNLGACIHAVRERVAFIQTSVLDRTGDEIRTSTRAGPMVRTSAMGQTAWLDAYEKRNVATGLRHGFARRAQIGKGLWAAPERMHNMLVEKIAHPCSGANAAAVPSPTAATLHALHYHQVEVFDRQRVVELEPAPDLDALLTPPLAESGIVGSDHDVRAELDSSAPALLSAVVHWIGVRGGSPGTSEDGRTEDQATLRVLSQHIANWLLHDVCTREQVIGSLQRSAEAFDRQGTGNPHDRPLGIVGGASAPLQLACDLVFQGTEQANGYVEPVLRAWREKLDASEA